MNDRASAFGPYHKINDHAVLTAAQMAACDAFAVQHGIPGTALMEAAGCAVVDALLARFALTPTLVLCGPGNNGGDGFVVARHLLQRGWPVRLALLGSRDALQGDAAWAAGLWPDVIEPFAGLVLADTGLIVDAVFGAGLNRPVDGLAATVLMQVRDSGLPVVAVDVPSGVMGDSGQRLGPVAPARLTVSFFRPKPAHLLLPGRQLCGEVELADIGIPAAALTHAVSAACWRNGPQCWPDLLRGPQPEDHKYRRGHVVVFGGTMSGATRLAAMAAQRMGAGLVTVAAPSIVAMVHRLALPSAIIVETDSLESCVATTRAAHVSALLVGPGGGADAEAGAFMRELVLALLATRCPLVLDADALSAFRDTPARLLNALHAACVLTPHAGEFARLFPVSGDKLADARAAAAQCGAVVLYKGYDTVIAAPDGRAILNDSAPADLAVAGAGDVLAGLIAALLAQGGDAFAAAACAAWVHGVLACRVGAGLLAEDLPAALPTLLAEMRQDGQSRQFR